MKVRQEPSLSQRPCCPASPHPFTDSCATQLSSSASAPSCVFHSKQRQATQTVPWPFCSTIVGADALPQTGPNCHAALLLNSATTAQPGQTGCRYPKQARSPQRCNSSYSQSQDIITTYQRGGIPTTCMQPATQLRSSVQQATKT